MLVPKVIWVCTHIVSWDPHHRERGMVLLRTKMITVILQLKVLGNKAVILVEYRRTGHVQVICRVTIAGMFGKRRDTGVPSGREAATRFGGRLLLSMSRLLASR